MRVGGGRRQKSTQVWSRRGSGGSQHGSVQLHAIDETSLHAVEAREPRSWPAKGRHYALVAAKDGGPAAFVDRREATKLPDTHLKTWESKSTS